MGFPPPEVARMYTKRSKREGYWDDFRLRKRAMELEHGMERDDAFWAAAKEYGFVDEAHERELYDDFQKTVNMTAAGVQRLRREAQRESDRVRVLFEDALESLPDSASATAEWDWIRSHPAMSRKARTERDTVVLMVEDIVAPYAAPSKAAVHALQQWANNPAEFYKRDMDYQKKKLQESLGKNGEAPSLDAKDTRLEAMGVDQARQLLSSLKG